MFDLTQSIGNLVYEERANGKHTPTNICGPFFIFFSQFGAILYFFVVLKFLRTCGGYITADITIEADIFDTMINRLASLARCIPIASFCASSIALIGILVPKHKNKFHEVFIIVSGLLALLFGFLITYAFRYVLKHLEGHVTDFAQSSIEIRSVFRRLKRAYYLCGGMSAIIFLSCVSYASTDHLWNEANYLFRSLRIVLPPLGIYLIATTHSTNVQNYDISDEILLDSDPNLVTKFYFSFTSGINFVTENLIKRSLSYSNDKVCPIEVEAL